jgi:hypothetical protein
LEILLLRVVVCTSEFVDNKSSLLFSFCGRFDTVQGNDVDWVFNCVWELISTEGRRFELFIDEIEEDDG